MFLNRYQHTVDEKGRLSIPSKYRAFLQDGLVLCRWFDPCLAVFSQSGFEALSERYANLPLADPDARASARDLYSNAEELTLDPQGRIVVPARFRDMASIKNDVWIIGVGKTHFEIWDKAAWEFMEKEYRSRTEAVGRQQLGVNL
jgi:MraZ protein